MWCIQLTEEFESAALANTALKRACQMPGYLGGRTLKPTGPYFAEPYKLLAYFDDEGASINNMGQNDFPEGMKLVYIPKRLRKWLGIK